MKSDEYIKYLVIIFIVILVVTFFVYKSGAPTDLSAFATCITDSGTEFYGAFWCPHCQKQKALFGPASELLPYIECSSADGQSQLEVCDQAGIHNYPTWIFPDGSRSTGEVALEELAQRTNCSLPLYLN